MLARGEIIPNVRKIAVLRANGVGDFMFALPALESLRAAYPAAEIVLLGLPWHAELLTGRPGPVDRVVPVPPSRGVNVMAGRAEDPAELQRFFAAMREERFDLALQLHGGGKNSNPFVRRLGARVAVGPCTPDAEALDGSLPYVYFQNEIIRHLETAALAGAKPVTLEPRLQVTPRDLAEARAAVPESGRPLAVLHPGATDSRRWWPAEKFAAVGDALASAGASVVVSGGPKERHLAAAVVAKMRAPALDLSGRLSLHALTGLLSRCAVVVSNDSGPLHLAVSVGTPSVGMYWCFNLLTCCPVTRSRHRPLVSWRLNCPVCGAPCTEGRCEHAASFVDDVPTEDVVREALELFRRGKSLGVPAAPAAPLRDVACST